MDSRGASGARILAISAAAMWFNGTMTVPLPVRSLNLEALTSGREPAVAARLVTW